MHTNKHIFGIWLTILLSIGGYHGLGQVC